jgi:hypothetical protein
MIRLFNPETDTKQQLLDLWNQALGTNLFTIDHLNRLDINNVVVVVADSDLVGFAFLLDGGMPFAILDQLYIRPRYQRFATLRDVMAFVEDLCSQRGIKWFYSLLPGTGGEAEQSVDLLHRRAKWKAQYLGEKPMLCRSVTMSTLAHKS